MTTQPGPHATPPSPREMARAFTPALTDLVTHIAFYAGFPAAISASAIAARTLLD